MPTFPTCPRLEAQGFSDRARGCSWVTLITWAFAAANACCLRSSGCRLASGFMPPRPLAEHHWAVLTVQDGGQPDAVAGAHAQLGGQAGGQCLQSRTHRFGSGVGGPEPQQCTSGRSRRGGGVVSPQSIRKGTKPPGSPRFASVNRQRSSSPSGATRESSRHWSLRPALP